MTEKEVGKMVEEVEREIKNQGAQEEEEDKWD
jgi:hypothetical protein